MNKYIKDDDQGEDELKVNLRLEKENEINRWD